MGIHYLALNNKTQVITPTQMGEMVCDIVSVSIRSLLNPELTASWEKGLTYVSEGKIGTQEYMDKLERFISAHTDEVRRTDRRELLKKRFDYISRYYSHSDRSTGRKKHIVAKNNKGEEQL